MTCIDWGQSICLFGLSCLVKTTIDIGHFPDVLFAKPRAQAPEDVSPLGIATTALGLASPRPPDLATAYIPIALNQFLHASAPIRVVLALLHGLKWLMTSGVQNAAVCTKGTVPLGVLLYDGLGGLILRWVSGVVRQEGVGAQVISVHVRSFVER
ncbi:hypothetical protein B0H16DRAFT_691474 [Mycena metata]|uniref:Uncharacterized protein n=1 Tax=Mycena metata TaxID=1033252 RepID=A0AAD7GUR3_9AGAR|nr:hypothetical protein B0H16DRAFT_691474 [Mycena metata]